jgi:hypothetical protein
MKPVNLNKTFLWRWAVEINQPGAASIFHAYNDFSAAETCTTLALVKF